MKAPVITKEEEIRDLKRLAENLRNQLAKALKTIVELKTQTSRGEIAS